MAQRSCVRQNANHFRKMWRRERGSWNTTPFTKVLLLAWILSPSLSLPVASECIRCHFILLIRRRRRRPSVRGGIEREFFHFTNRRRSDSVMHDIPSNFLFSPIGCSWEMKKQEWPSNDSRCQEVNTTTTKKRVEACARVFSLFFPNWKKLPTRHFFFKYHRCCCCCGYNISF